MVDRATPVGRCAAILYRQFQVYLNHELKHEEINSSEFFHIKQLLFDRDGLSQDELSRKLHIDKAAVTRTVKALVDKGFVCRKSDDNDRRVNRVHLTVKARAFEYRMHDILKRWNTMIEQGLDTEAVTVTRESLQAMARNALEYNRFTS